MMKQNAAYWIETLSLTAHPEGGYFRRIYRSPDRITQAGLPERYTVERVCASAIYFLVPSGEVSKFHLLKCEEIWCYHLGASLTLSIIEETGKLRRVILGPDIEHGEHLQTTVPHSVWFDAHVNKKDEYTLVSCITAPGFDFEDFELAMHEALIRKYPEHKDVIEMLT